MMISLGLLVVPCIGSTWILLESARVANLALVRLWCHLEPFKVV